MKIFRIILLLLFSMAASVANAGSSEDSIIAIAPDEELCAGVEGNFLPLPNPEDMRLAFEFINKEIDNNFGEECKLNGLLLKGPININTFNQIQLGYKLLEARRNPISIGANTLWVDSPGGLVFEAMKIGDFIAEREMGSIVLFDGRCFSSCVLIYAASKSRGGIGAVGIHRPFASEINAESISYSEYLKQYEAITPVLKRYLSKYGVSPGLVDAMNVIPSDQIKVLTMEELDGYGLGFSNVAAKEHDKARTIQICGQEYHNLDQRFHGFLDSCRERFGITVLDEKDRECWSLARQAFPDYSTRFDECKEKKGRKLQRAADAVAE